MIDSSIQFNTVNKDDINIRYAYSGDTAKPGLLFIHGTPGDWAAFENYLVNSQLQKQFLVVSVDRPGWGKSVTSNSLLNGEFDHQAKSIAAVLKQFPKKKWIIVGHSLGASLAPQVVLEAPDSVSGLLLLAGSLEPKLGKPRWYNYAATTWVISKMVGKKMTRSNREIMKLNQQLISMSSLIKMIKINTDVIIIQGLKDKLVSPKNPTYVLREWQNNFTSIELIELKNAGHFLPWKESDEIINAIFALNNKNHKNK